MITEAHVEKLLEHWATEHWRVDAAYRRWHEGQTGGLAGQVVDRTRESSAHAVVTTRAPRARITRRLILKAMRDAGDQAMVPDWAGGDPMRCKETRAGAAPRWPMDAVAEQVDCWVIALWRWDPRAALALISHYRHGDRVGEGARWVATASELPVTRHGYLAAIARGRLAVRRAADTQLEIAS